MSGSATVIDLIENHFDGVPAPDKPLAVDVTLIDELAGQLHDFYSASSVEPPGEVEFRTNACGVSRLRLSWLLGELLYAHQAVIYDPLEWALTYATADTRRAEVVEAIRTLAVLEPLIRAGTVIPVPAGRIIAERHAEVEEAARELVGDHATFWWKVVEAGTDSDPFGSRPYSVARPWARHLSVADATESHLTPIDNLSFRLYEWTQKQAVAQLRSVDVGLLIAARAFAADLPWLSPSDPATLVKIRQEESDFEDWRAALRRATRALNSVPTDNNFGAEARDVFSDELGFAAEKLRLRRSPLIERLQQGALHVSFGAAGLLAGTTAIDVPAKGPLVGLATGQLAAFLTRTIIRRDDPTRPGKGRTAVLAALVNDHPEPASPFGRVED